MTAVDVSQLLTDAIREDVPSIATWQVQAAADAALAVLADNGLVVVKQDDAMDAAAWLSGYEAVLLTRDLHDHANEVCDLAARLRRSENPL